MKPAASPTISTAVSTNLTAQGFAIPETLDWHQSIVAEISGKTVLSVFSGTCTLGILAAKSGARFVVNIDHDELAIATAKDFVRLSALPIRPRFIISDAFAAMRQLAGIGQNERVRGKRMPPFPKLEARQFDLVVIDPPLYAKSPFGVVDLLADYAGVFKPALLCTSIGGTIICTNSAANLDRAAWIAQLQRTAAKAGRPVKSIAWLKAESASAATAEENLPSVVMLRLE